MIAPSFEILIDKHLWPMCNPVGHYNAVCMWSSALKAPLKYLNQKKKHFKTVNTDLSYYLHGSRDL